MANKPTPGARLAKTSLVIAEDRGVNREQQ
jgi:hypothetical protein